MLTLGSLFAGIGGFDEGFHRAGMSCLWQVEIDADCRNILARHFPDAERFEDVREVGKRNLMPVDIITGGFPCQDLSVAGKREGLTGARSGLFHEMVRITYELRPSLLVFENVPGLLSSDDGRDFARVLISLDAIGYSGAWTDLDAQWFGVAQRRRRIFGVFARGDIGAERCAEILSLRTGLRRNTPTRGKKGKGVAAPITRSFASHGGRTAGNNGRPFNLITSTMRSGGDAHSGFTEESGLVAFGQTDFADFQEGNVTLRSQGGDAGGGSEGLVVSDKWPAEVSPPLDTSWADRMAGSTNQEWVSQNGGRFVPDVAHVLKAEGHDASEDGTSRGVPLIASAFAIQHAQINRKDSAGPQAKGFQADISFTLDSRPTADAVAWHENKSGQLSEGETAKALRSGASHNYQGVGVRRLTPRECERLQGFPDDWTAIGADGKAMSDSARYRMLGNAVAVPCAEWIGKRIIDSCT